MGKNTCYTDKEDQSSDPKHSILDLEGEKYKYLWTLLHFFLVATVLCFLSPYQEHMLEKRKHADIHKWNPNITMGTEQGHRQAGPQINSCLHAVTQPCWLWVLLIPCISPSSPVSLPYTFLPHLVPPLQSSDSHSETSSHPLLTAASLAPSVSSPWEKATWSTSYGHHCFVSYSHGSNWNVFEIAFMVLICNYNSDTCLF